MCDTIIKKNLTLAEKPTYVYKRVQKVGDGKYVSAVMGEPLKLNTWKKAPKRDKIRDTLGDSSTCLIRKLKRAHRTKTFSSSSEYLEHHDGMFAAFKVESAAFNADLISNFVKPKLKTKVQPKLPSLYPTIIVKCEVKGTVHASSFLGKETYLSEYLKVVEEGRLIR
jgi:hypothetical protein